MFSTNNAFNDATWRSVTLMTWTDVESSVYLIAACLPSLRPLMRALARPQIFKKQYWSNATHPTSEEHASSKRSARATFSGADGFQLLDGGHSDTQKVERGENSIQTIASGGATLDEGLEMAQLTADGRIRVTNALQVDFESSKSHVHRQDSCNNK